MTYSEWDNTPWGGTPARALQRTRPEWVKAVDGFGAWSNAIPSITGLTNAEPQERAATLLKAYRVGWFHKAGRRISYDVGALEPKVYFEDGNDNGDENVVTDPGSHVPIEDLSPEEQLKRLLTTPNEFESGSRQRQMLQIRLDFAGVGFLHLEGVGSDPNALPTAIYGISPARMWPSRDRNGTIVGWVMDYNRSTGTGVPFYANEIIPISNASENDGDLWGASVVEAVFAEVPITTLIARHTADILTTGGRLAGMLWPKDRSLTEDEFQDAQRAWRNVASDPNAARRLLLFPEPMEYSKGAATPAEIGIPELAALHQTQVLTAFPISPQMLGVPAPAGLNSGETRRWDRREYWEGTIHPRSTLLQDALQRALVARYERVVGASLKVSFIERALDDAPALVEKAGAFRALVNVGFDPRDAIVAVGLAGIKWNGLPPAVDPYAGATPANGAPMTALQSQGQVTGGMRVLAGDTTHSDSSVIQQELVGTRKALDEVLAELPTRKQDRIKGLHADEYDLQDPFWSLLDTGLRRGYTNAQLADGVPAERFPGLRSVEVPVDPGLQWLQEAAKALAAPAPDPGPDAPAGALQAPADDLEPPIADPDDPGEGSQEPAVTDGDI